MNMDLYDLINAGETSEANKLLMNFYQNQLKYFEYYIKILTKNNNTLLPGVVEQCKMMAARLRIIMNDHSSNKSLNIKPGFTK